MSCSVGGLIGGNVTWNPTLCDPYIATGSIIVQPGATLTIEAGTRVQFTSLKALTVQGTLVARGTAQNPLRFTSNAPAPGKGDWGYIHFTDSSTDATVDANGNYVSGSILQHAIVEYGGGATINENGVVRVEASSPYLDHNTIRLNKADGIRVWNNGAPPILNNQVTNNGITSSAQANGVYVASAGTVLVRGNTVSNNTAYGIYVYNQPYMAAEEDGVTATATISETAVLGTSTIDGNTVTGNSSAGILVYNYNSATTISGNTVSNNGGNGLYVSGGAITVSDNAVSSNGSAGIDLQAGAAFAVTGNEVTGNASTGIWNASYGAGTISDNVIANNTGGGIYWQGASGDITGNNIANNSTNYGAGISVGAYSTVDIVDNSITGNQASVQGGGIYVYYYSYPTANIDGNIVSDNSANYGGGIYFWGSGSIINNRIVDNEAVMNNGGGGIYLASQAPVNNNDLYDNTAGSPNLFNDVANANPVGNDVNASNNYWGTTDSNVIEEHVWHFIDDSSLSIVNYIPFLSAPVFPPNFDPNNNGTTDVGDIIMIGEVWGATNAAALRQFDYNRNGVIDIADIMMLASQFGQPQTEAASSGRYP